MGHACIALAVKSVQFFWLGGHGSRAHLCALADDLGPHRLHFEEPPGRAAAMLVKIGASSMRNQMALGVGDGDLETDGGVGGTFRLVALADRVCALSESWQWKEEHAPPPQSSNWTSEVAAECGSNRFT